jgi:phosphatidyl-myo-inositol alpha-mannosyltransferase
VSCQAHRLANELVSLGEQVTCFSYSPRPQDALYDHVKLTYSSRPGVARKFEAGLTFAALRKRGFDILHYHGDDYLCRGSDRRVRTLYGSAMYEALFAGFFLRGVRQALFYVLEWVSCLRRGAKVGISKTTTRALPLVKNIIPCCVPLARFFPEGSKSGRPSLLFVGDLDSRKRGRLLVNTFASAVAPALPDAELVVVGPQPCTGPQIRYRGRVDEQSLIGEYRAAWVYCCVSSYEGFGVPLLEAMACGAAVVACDTMGVSELLRHNYNCLLCTEKTLGETAVRLLKDHALRQRLVANGLSFVKRFDAPGIARAYQGLYRELAPKSGAAA